MILWKGKLCNKEVRCRGNCVLLGQSRIFSDVAEPVSPISVNAFAKFSVRFEYLTSQRRCALRRYSNFQELYGMFQKPDPACTKTPLMQSEEISLCNRPHVAIIFLWPLRHYMW